MFQQKDSSVVKTIKYLALGDSYTIGESVAENERWPVQLVDSLIIQGLLIQRPKIIAKTGWTTDELKSAILLENPDNDYDLVSLLIGVNNQYRGRSPEEFRDQFKELLKMASGFVQNQNGVVFVLSIPDWGVTPFAEGRDRKLIADQIDLFNSVLKEETLNIGAAFFDITDISKMAANDSTLLAPDKLHPSGKMYSLWVERILPEIINILKNRR